MIVLSHHLSHRVRVNFWQKLTIVVKSDLVEVVKVSVCPLYGTNDEASETSRIRAINGRIFRPKKMKIHQQ